MDLIGRLKRVSAGLLCLALLVGTLVGESVGIEPGNAVSSGTIGLGVQSRSIQFSGRLEQAPSVLGPWREVVGATSPYFLNFDEPLQFYRSLADEGLFGSNSVLELRLEGPFQQHFDLAFAGLPDGIFPPQRAKPFFEAMLIVEQLELPVTIRVRGNSSLQECPFPKLKLKISRKNREGTLFADAREIKIGTHCAEGGRGTIGRLREELAVDREALLYVLMGAMGFEGPRVRRAVIDYQDTSLGEDESRFGWTVRRKAFLFDHVELVAERLGGRALEDEEVFALGDLNFDPTLVLDLMFFHALIGNWDYSIGANGPSLWNTEVIEMGDGSLLPIAGDFDLASWVTGQVRVTAPRDFLPKEPELVRQMRFELERIQTLVGAERFLSAGHRWVREVPRITRVICTTEIDDAGLKNALEHLGAFEEAISRLLDSNREPTSARVVSLP